MKSNVLKIGKDVKEIDWENFRDDVTVPEHIEVEEGNPHFFCEDDCLIEKKTGALLAVGIRDELPNSGIIREIGPFALSRRSFDEPPVKTDPLRIPDSVVVIRWGGLMFMTKNHVRIIIPKSVEKIEPLALRVFSGTGNVEIIFHGDPELVT